MISARWDETDDYLRDLSSRDKRFEAGYRNFCFLRDKFKKYWGEMLLPQHPLFLHLIGASRFLEGPVVRLKCAENDPSVDKIIARLAEPTGYQSALQELDTYRRLKLAGLEPSFIKERKRTTPDILIRSGGQEIWVEATSITDDIEVSPAENLLALQMRLGLLPGVLIGGIILGPVSAEDIVSIEAQAEEVAMLAKITGTLQTTVSRKGPIFAIERGEADAFVPERFRHGFLLYYERKTPHTKDVIMRIQEKIDKKYTDGVAGFIVLYDYFMDDEELLQILRTEPDSVSQFLEGHPEILGVALIMPSGYTPDLVQTGNTRSSTRICKKYLLRPEDVPEMIIIWPNPRAKIDNIKIVQAFDSFEVNQVDQNFAPASDPSMNIPFSRGMMRITGGSFLPPKIIRKPI